MILRDAQRAERRDTLGSGSPISFGTIGARSIDSTTVGGWYDVLLPAELARQLPEPGLPATAA